MVQKDKILRLLEEYDSDKITIATLCSHSSMQIFNGARKEGFRTLGIAVTQNTKFYDAFPLAKPDSFLSVESYKALLEYSSDLIDENVIIIPHGSLVEYLGIERFESLAVPTFGNHGCKKFLVHQEPPRYVCW